MMQNVYLGVILHVNHKKNTIYRGFNLISYTIFCKTSAKIAIVVGDVTGLQQRHHPIKYTSSCREDQTCFSMKAKSFLHIATFCQSTPSPLVPLWGYEFMWTEEQKSICRTLKRRWRHSCLASDYQFYVDQRLVVKESSSNHRWCTIPILLVILAVIIKPFFAPSTVFFTGSRRNVFHLVPQLKYLLIRLSSFSRKDSQDKKQTWSPWNACTISQLR